MYLGKQVEGTMNTKLGKAIKMARVGAGETQAAFSANFDVAQQTITDWERTGIVPVKHWDRLKERYGVDVVEYNKNIKTKNQTGNNSSADVIYSTTVQTNAELTPQMLTLVDLIKREPNPDLAALELIKQLLNKK